MPIGPQLAPRLRGASRASLRIERNIGTSSNWRTCRYTNRQVRFTPKAKRRCEKLVEGDFASRKRYLGIADSLDGPSFLISNTCLASKRRAMSLVLVDAVGLGQGASGYGSLIIGVLGYAACPKPRS